MSNSGLTFSELERHREYPLTVLLAEEDEDLRRLLEQSLRSDGFKVIAIGSGHALAQALMGLILGDPANFDVLVSSVRMPGWPAFSALNGLRCAGYHVPAVFLTACPGPDVELLASELGARLLTKPVDLAELYRAVLSRRFAGARMAAELGIPSGR
ncbi:MAG TPA: response regulator [Polyangiaceae bacterium]